MNPFKHVKNWVKSELANLSSIMECIARKESMEAMKLRTEQKVRSDKNKSAKLAAGGTTLSTIFKGSSGKAAESQKILDTIQQEEKDIVNYEVLKNFLIVYCHEVAIPSFKENTMVSYLECMHKFSHEEVNNAKKNEGCWSEFL